MKIAILGEGITAKAVREKIKELAGFAETDIDIADLVVASPGIAKEDLPQTKSPIISEIDFAYRLFQSHKYGIPPKIIAISGTNGKTTTTTLLGLVLNCPVAGNIGIPLISLVGQGHKYIACEVSSYQLENSPLFKPYISVILNITQDHLTRHKTMANYCQAKATMVFNQGKDGFFVYNKKDKYLKDIAKKAKCRKIPFSAKSRLEQNIIAVKKVAKICKVSKNKVVEVLRDFKGVEHRIEFVKEHQGVKFYNDSKATNPDSTIVALEAFKKNVVIILGGTDKLTSLKELAQKLKKSAKLIILLGEAKNRFRAEFLQEKIATKKILTVNNMQEAVSAALKKSCSKDIILLSPACASFDMYDNFEARGKDFKRIVEELTIC